MIAMFLIATKNSFLVFSLLIKSPTDLSYKMPYYPTLSTISIVTISYIIAAYICIFIFVIKYYDDVLVLNMTHYYYYIIIIIDYSLLCVVFFRSHVLERELEVNRMGGKVPCFPAHLRDIQLSFEAATRYDKNRAIFILQCITRWWFGICFYFHPYLGKICNLTNTFQMGGSTTNQIMIPDFLRKFQNTVPTRRWREYLEAQLENHDLHHTISLFRGYQMIYVEFQIMCTYLNMHPGYFSCMPCSKEAVCHFKIFSVLVRISKSTPPSYCWWFRNPKANHLGWFQNPVNNGISTTNLNWWVCRISGCHQPPIISSRRFRGTFRWSFSQALEALCLNKNDLPNFLWWNLHRIWASPRNSWWHSLNSTEIVQQTKNFLLKFTKFYENCFVLASRIRKKKYGHFEVGFQGACWDEIWWSSLCFCSFYQGDMKHRYLYKSDE